MHLPRLRFLEPFLWVVGIGIFITVSLAVGIWGLSRIGVEREYLTLAERVRIAAVYPTLPTDAMRFAYLRSQVPLRRPLVEFNTSLASECRSLYESFDAAMRQASAVVGTYAPPPFDETILSSEDAARVDEYTNMAIGLLRQYNECAVQ